MDGKAKREEEEVGKSFLGSKRKIWLIFVLNSHTENGMNAEENSLLLDPMKNMKKC